MTDDPRDPAVFRYGLHPRQFAELWLPADEPAGAVVVIHGGFWRARYTLELGRHLAADLVRHGWAAWNLEYRTVGSDGGWPATFADVAAGIDLLADVFAADGRPVVAVGHSAGGQLAVWAASRPRLPAGAPGAQPRLRLTGAVAQAGVVALARAARERVGDGAVLDLMGGAPDECAAAYAVTDPTALAPAAVPVLCVHSRGDEDVPYSQSETYVAAATAAGGRAALREVPGEHMALIDPASEGWRVVVRALDAWPSMVAD